MDMELNLYQVPEEGKEFYHPKGGRRTLFECWAMREMYCQLYNLRSGFLEQPHKCINECMVWNGNELYNTEFQITSDDGTTRLWMNTNDELMLEVCYDDRPNKFYLVY